MEDGIGHNSKIIQKALAGLKKVKEGEGLTEEGWLQYGAALNEGREMFPSDEQFGQWVKGNLPDTEQKEREAAMWAAEDLDRFYRVKGGYPNVRTVRGLHAKWKEEEKAKEDEDEILDDELFDVDNNNTDNSSQDKSSDQKPNTGSTPEDSEKKGEPGIDKKKPKPIHNPDYSIAEGMGAIKGIAELYAREYGGTPEEAADVLFSQTIKGCEEDSTSMSIARDRVKWFLKIKEVMDLAEPKMHDFLNQESKLKVIK